MVLSLNSVKLFLVIYSILKRIYPRIFVMPNGVRHLAKRPDAALRLFPTFPCWDCLIGVRNAPSGLRPLTTVRGDHLFLRFSCRKCQYINTLLSESTTKIFSLNLLSFNPHPCSFLSCGITTCECFSIWGYNENILPSHKTNLISKSLHGVEIFSLSHFD